MSTTVLSINTGTAAVLDAITTPNGQSWALAADTTNKQLRLFDGTTLGGIIFESGSDLTPYRLEAPINGATIALAAADEILVLNPAASIATLTVTMMAGVDRKQVRIVTRQRIDALTITGSGGDAVDWPDIELPQYGSIGLLYVASLTAWVMI